MNPTFAGKDNVIHNHIYAKTIITMRVTQKADYSNANF